MDLILEASPHLFPVRANFSAAAGRDGDSSDFVSVIWCIGVRQRSSWERGSLHHYRLELRGPARDVRGEGGGLGRCK
jgi:hypothetical protein